MKVSLLLIMAMIMTVAFTGCKGSIKEDTTTEAKKESVEESEETKKELDPEHLTGDDLAKLSNNHSLYIGIDDSVDFNGFGQVVRSDQIRYEAVPDMITDEVIYYSASYSDFVKKEDGSYDRKVYSRLYDTDGNILIDWKNTVYSQAFGKWIISRDYFDVNMDTTGIKFHAALLNTKSDKKLKDVWSMELMDEHHIVVSSFTSGILGIIDEKGRKLAGFPWSIEDGSDDCMVVGNYLVTYKENQEDFTYDLNVYDADLCLLGSLSHASDSSLYNEGMIGPYLRCGDSVFDMSQSDGNELYEIFGNSDVSYLDDEIAVFGDKLDPGYILFDTKKKEIISEKYYNIVLENEDADGTDTQKVNYFIGYRPGVIDKIDRKGKVVASAKFADVGNVSALKTGFVAISEDWEHEALYDSDLKEVIPVGTYTDISPVYEDETNPKNSLWSCGFYIDEQHQRMDLVKGDGSIIVKNASGIGIAKDGCIALSRGQWVGLIDLEGNWITKMKKYELENMD